MLCRDEITDQARSSVGLLRPLWRAREREPMLEVWGLCPQRDPRAEPLVGVRGVKSPRSWRLFCTVKTNSHRNWRQYFVIVTTTTSTIIQNWNDSVWRLSMYCAPIILASHKIARLEERRQNLQAYADLCSCKSWAADSRLFIYLFIYYCYKCTHYYYCYKCTHFITEPDKTIVCTIKHLGTSLIISFQPHCPISPFIIEYIFSVLRNRKKIRTSYIGVHWNLSLVGLLTL